MHKQRLALLILSFLGAVGLHMSTWITKTAYAAGEATERIIGPHETGLGRQAHLILLAIGLVAILAPGVKDGRLTNGLSDSLSRIGRLTAAGLAIALLATCYLSKQINADDPEALLTSYVIEAEGEIGVAEKDLEDANAALAAGKAEAEAAVTAAKAKKDAHFDPSFSNEEWGEAVATGETLNEDLAAAQAALDALTTAVSDAELGIEETKARAEHVRASTPVQMFDGQSFKSAGMGHLLGMLFGLLGLVALVCSGSGTVGSATEKRWAVASLALLASASVLCACQTATVGPLEVGVRAWEHPEGKAVLVGGLVIFFGVLSLRRDKAFGWIDGLLFTGLLGALLGASLIHLVDVVLTGTQPTASQLLALALPAMALVSLWPIAACCPPKEDAA
jgi:hypothetical protein